MIAHCDFETRSMLDLKVVGLHNYARHPSTEPWVMAWAIGDEEPNVWMLGEPMPARLALHVTAGGIVAAHNSPFELEIWNEILVPRYNWRPLRPEQTVCTMAAAYAMGLPGALEDAALAMGLRLQKDMEGRSLILRMARPRRTEGGTPVWWSDQEKVLRGVEYCRQDVRVERALHERLMPLGKHERAVWLADYAINRRGIHLDAESARAALALTDRTKLRADIKLAEATGGEVAAVGALAAMKAYFARLDPAGTYDSLAKDGVITMLDGVLHPKIREVLEIRQEVGKASIAKLDVMLNIAGEDDRMRGTKQYHGATTGRWAGRKIQPDNFPRTDLKPAQVEAILELVRNGQDEAIDMIYGAPLSVTSRCLRSFINAAPGHVLVGGDFGNVEGRGVAWFSGEDWKLEVFRKADRKEGPGVYEVAAGKIYDIDPSTIQDPSTERQIGKVSELALGYQGGVGAFQRMAGTYGVHVADAQADEIKVAWRNAHPLVVQTWKELDTNAKLAVQNPGQIFAAGAAGRQAKFKVAGSFLWCMLPSGRALCYPYPKIVTSHIKARWPGDTGVVQQLTYMTMPSPDDWKRGRVVPDPINTPKWARVGIYGGKWMENIVQAFCRDLLVDTVLLPYADKVVHHVHDEGWIEVPKEQGMSAQLAMTLAMNTPPEWAKDFPLFAKVKILERWGK